MRSFLFILVLLPLVSCGQQVQTTPPLEPQTKSLGSPAIQEVVLRLINNSASTSNPRILVVEGTIITRIIRDLGNGDQFVFRVSSNRINIVAVFGSSEINELDTFDPESAGPPTEFNLMGIRSADITMTGGVSDPLTFNLSNGVYETETTDNFGNELDQGPGYIPVILTPPSP
jgi:hypothetical protein